MKQPPSAVVIFLSAALVVLSGWNYQDAIQSSAKLMKVVGVVEVRNSSTAAWHLISAKTKLSMGSELRTKASSFTLVTFSDSSRVLVRERSTIRIVCENSSNEVCGVLLMQGTLAFDAKDARRFEVDAPNAAAVLRNSEGAATYDPKSGVAMFNVQAGEAEIYGKLGGCRLVVPAGHSATIDSSGCRAN